MQTWWPGLLPLVKHASQMVQIGGALKRLKNQMQPCTDTGPWDESRVYSEAFPKRKMETKLGLSPGWQAGAHLTSGTATNV